MLWISLTLTYFFQFNFFSHYNILKTTVVKNYDIVCKTLEKNKKKLNVGFKLSTSP